MVNQNQQQEGSNGSPVYLVKVLFKASIRFLNCQEITNRLNEQIHHHAWKCLYLPLWSFFSLRQQVVHLPNVTCFYENEKHVLIYLLQPILSLAFFSCVATPVGHVLVLQCNVWIQPRENTKPRALLQIYSSRATALRIE